MSTEPFLKLTHTAFMQMNQSLKESELRTLLYLQTLNPFNDRKIVIETAVIAEHVGLTQRTIQRALNRLDELGYIQWKVIKQEIMLNNQATPGSLEATPGSLEATPGSLEATPGSPTRLKMQLQQSFQNPSDLIQINTDLIQINKEEINKEKSAFAHEATYATEETSEDFHKTEILADTPEFAASEVYTSKALDEPVEEPATGHQIVSVRKTRTTPKPQESDWLMFVGVYNAEKPSSWAKCSSLNQQRLKLLKNLHKEHGENTAVVFQEALKFINQDPWWQKQSLGFTNFVRHVTDLAEKAEVIGTGGLESFAKEYDRILNAIS